MQGRLADQGKAGAFAGRLALGYHIQKIKKLREANGGRFGALNQGFAFRAECGNAECHGDAMVPAGVDCGAMKCLTAGDVDSVFELLHFSAHCAKIASNQRYAIGFFDAEFFCVANADAAASVGTDGSEDGKFVDELRREGSADCGGPEAFRFGGDLYGADEFGMSFLKLEDGDARSEGC